MNSFQENIVKWALLGLEDELDEKDLSKATSFFLNKINGLKEKLAEMSITLEENKLGEKEDLILYLMMLGLGRNRTCHALNHFNVTRKDVEKVRDLCGFKDLEERKENEKYITALKWDTKSRAKWKKMINDEDWEEIKKEYLEGDSPVNIGAKYKVSSHIISMRLRDEDLFDELRSTFTKNKIAEEQFKEIDDELIVKLVKDNKYEPITNIWRLAQIYYPWLLRRQFFDKISELGLERTEEEINSLKTDKARPSREKHNFKIKPYIIEAIEEVLGPTVNIQEKYADSSIEEFVSLTREVNKKNSKKIYVSEKQLYRVITDNPNFKRNTSLEQDLFYQELVLLFPKEEMLEEYKFDGYSKRFDIYIKSLNIAIDFNGDYWHSDEVLNETYGISAKEHHKKRVDILKEKGVKLIYIWSSDWKKNKQEILKCLKEKDWENPIFNQYESPMKSS